MQSYEQFINKNFEKEEYITEKLRMKREALITEHDQLDRSKREDLMKLQDESDQKYIDVQLSLCGVV